MKIITAIVLVSLCTGLINARVLPPQQQEPQPEPDSPETPEENVSSTTDEENAEASGSAMEDVDALEGSASGLNEEQNDAPVQLPKPMQFPFMKFRGPVTITPMEPGINRQKPYRYNRPCFFCFPRGRLGRVEVTAPGGPFLMNNYGLVGYGMGYPNMGMPPAGEAPNPDMGFPEYGPYGGAPCGGGPCNEPEGPEGPEGPENNNEYGESENSMPECKH